MDQGGWRDLDSNVDELAIPRNLVGDLQQVDLLAVVDHAPHELLAVQIDEHVVLVVGERDDPFHMLRSKNTQLAARRIERESDSPESAPLVVERETRGPAAPALFIIR